MRATVRKPWAPPMIALCLARSLAACTVGHAETVPAAGQIVTYSASATASSAPRYQATLTGELVAVISFNHHSPSQQLAVQA